MKLLVLGSTGGVGQQIVAQALEAGHEVTAFVRDPGKMLATHDRLRVVTGSLTGDDSGLADAMRGQDAVVSALGRGMSLKSTGLIQRTVPRILAAMQANGVRRLMFTSAIGVGVTIRDAPLLSRVVIRLLLRDIYADKIAGEAPIHLSDLDWTLVQPAQLTDGPLTRVYRAGERLKMRGRPTVSRADVAHFILSQLDCTVYQRRVVLLAY